MEAIISFLIPAVAILLLLKVLTAPIRLVFKLLINTACGFLCLMLLNAISGYTGCYIETTFLNSAIVGVLGVPGILLLVLAGFLL